MTLTRQQKIYTLIGLITVLIILILVSIINFVSPSSTSSNDSSIQDRAIADAQKAARDNTRQRDLVEIKALIEDYYGYVQAEYPENLDFNIESQQVSIKQNPPHTILQPRLAKILPISGKLAYNANGKLLNCGDVNRATTDQWEISYSRSADKQSYTLCTVLENGNVFDLSFQ